VSNNNQSRKQVFLGSLHYDTVESEIVAAFAGIGVITTNVRIPKDPETGRSKGYAFVDVDESCTLETGEIISGIEGVMFHGRPCRADRVHERAERRGGGSRERSGPPPERQGGDDRKHGRGKRGRRGEEW
jgi:RNA recognition motif-containing protein